MQHKIKKLLIYNKSFENMAKFKHLGTSLTKFTFTKKLLVTQVITNVYFLWNPKVCYRVRCSPTLDTIMSQTIPVKITKLLVTYFPSTSCYFLSLRSIYPLQQFGLKSLQAMLFP